MRHDMTRVDIAGVDNAGVVKSAIWVIIIGYFNKRFMNFNGLFVAALMVILTRRPTYADCTQSSRFFGAYTPLKGDLYEKS